MDDRCLKKKKLIHRVSVKWKSTVLRTRRIMRVRVCQPEPVGFTSSYSTYRISVNKPVWWRNRNNPFNFVAKQPFSCYVDRSVSNELNNFQLNGIKKIQNPVLIYSTSSWLRRGSNLKTHSANACLSKIYPIWWICFTGAVLWFFFNIKHLCVSTLKCQYLSRWQRALGWVAWEDFV